MFCAGEDFFKEFLRFDLNKNMTIFLKTFLLCGMMFKVLIITKKNYLITLNNKFVVLVNVISWSFSNFEINVGFLKIRYCFFYIIYFKAKYIFHPLKNNSRMIGLKILCSSKFRYHKHVNVKTMRLKHDV